MKEETKITLKRGKFKKDIIVTDTTMDCERYFELNLGEKITKYILELRNKHPQ